MKAMILAAGKGERMRGLTQNCPKPLLQAAGKPLLEYWLQRLEAAGVMDVVINTAYLGEQIESYVNARQGALHIELSREPEPLETGGALHRALPLLGDAPFLLINSDVFCEINLADVINRADAGVAGAYFVLVNNPEHNVEGDFVLDGSNYVRRKLGAAAREGLVGLTGGQALTFSGISVINPNMIRQYPECRQKFPLREVFYWALEQQQIQGEFFPGYWLDVGTPERLAQLNDYLKESK